MSQRWAFSIRGKVIALFSILIAISVGSSLLVVRRIHDVAASVDQQQVSVEQQAKEVHKQAALIHQQHTLAANASAINQAQSYLNTLQYWYFQASLTGLPQSLSSAHQAFDAFSAQLDRIAKMDPSKASDIKDMHQVLDQYKAQVEQMYQAFTSGDVAKGKTLVGPVRIKSMRLAVALNSLSVAYGKKMDAASQGIAGAGKAVQASGAEVRQGVSDIRSAVSQALHSSYSTMVGLVVVAILLGAAFLRSVRRPIRQVGSRIRQIEEASDLNASLEYHRKDELLEITGAFDSMLGKFRDLIRGLADSVQVLGEVASAGEASSRSLGEQVQHQQAETSQVATATNQMTATAAGIQESTDNASQLAGQVSALTNSGQEAAQDSTMAISRLTRRIDDASKVIHELAQRTESIGTVLDVIRGISEQTNLLALNAAIEAARAGESGRGFAVVADEVRGLAKRTGESTGEIQEVVTSLQTDARRAVEQISQSLEESRSTVSSIERCGQALQEINAAAGQMREINHQVAEAMAEQSEAVQSIDRNLTNLSQQVELIGQQAHEAGAMSQRLNSVSGDLRKAIDRFQY